jgi:hypothetical protein
MKLNFILYALLPSALAANSFAGANVRLYFPPLVKSRVGLTLSLWPQNYYIYALPQADRITILDGTQAAGMKASVDIAVD